MRQEDVAQVSDIDREAFPTQLPPPNYKHELQKRLAHYFVVCDQERTVEQSVPNSTPANRLARLISGWRHMFSRNQHPDKESDPSPRHYVVGFTGFWVLADETHISSIAVREAYRRRGIGEMLIITTINQATKLKARIITLEVRASNIAAQNLYSKYGFTQTGVRRGYYIDDREDAVIMSTQDIKSTAFRKQLQELEEALYRKLVIARL